MNSAVHSNLQNPSPSSRVVCDEEDIDMMLAELETQLKPIVERFSGEEHVVNNEEWTSFRERKLKLENNNNNNNNQEVYKYNPLRLPLGEDGRPKPYWQYKLNGFGETFSCEICGNHSYCGRREFEMHFNKWRHQHGMGCLGIPECMSMSTSFHGITSIEEANNLWTEMKLMKRRGRWSSQVYVWQPPQLYDEYFQV